MGTNYYAKVPGCPVACPHCSIAAERLHIGKSSAGWRFCFRLYEDGPVSVSDWRVYLGRPDVTIIDEYGETWAPEKFWARVEAKQSHQRHNDHSYGRFVHDEVADLTDGEFS
jgi:hypothetical protein